MRAELLGEPRLVGEARHREHAHARVQRAQDRERAEAERAHAVDQHGPARGRRRVQDRVERDAERVGEHRRLVADLVRDGNALRLVRGQQRREAARGVARVAVVDARRELAAAEVHALREVAALAPLAGREPPRGAREPRVEHHAVAHPPPPHAGPDALDRRHHLVAEHLRKRDPAGHRVVEGAVQVDLLGVAAADAAEARAQHDPVVGRQRRVGDLAQLDGRERADEGARGQRREQLGRDDARHAVLEDERVHRRHDSSARCAASAGGVLASERPGASPPASRGALAGGELCAPMGETMAFARSLSALALSLALGAPAAATTISFQNGFDGYAGADNESYSFDGTTNQDQIRVDLPNAAQPDGSYAWVIFDDIFGAGAVPEGSVILSATFEGFVRNPFIVADITRLLGDIGSRPSGPGADILDAGGIFWDNKQLVPAFHADCGNLVECDPAVPIAWDVTDMVQAWADGATNFGFLLLPETANGGKLFAHRRPERGTPPAPRDRVQRGGGTAFGARARAADVARAGLRDRGRPPRLARAAGPARGSRAPRCPRRSGTPCP